MKIIPVFSGQVLQERATYCLYGFAEDFLTLVLRAIPGSNEIDVKDFISRYLLDQNLTADVLNFIQLMEDQKKKFKNLQAVGITQFSQMWQNDRSAQNERSVIFIRINRHYCNTPKPF